MKSAYKIVEQRLIKGILDREFPQGTALEGERELAKRFDVSRLVVREALQRLAEVGWISLQKNRPPVINPYWSTGDLNMLGSISNNEDRFPVEVIDQILEFRTVVAPAYTKSAIKNDNSRVIACLAKVKRLDGSPVAVAKFDWELQSTLAALSGNCVYTLMLNSFSSLYLKMSEPYFSNPVYREIVLEYYRKLMRAAVNEDAENGEEVTRVAMLHRLHAFRQQILDEGNQKEAV